MVRDSENEFLGSAVSSLTLLSEWFLRSNRDDQRLSGERSMKRTVG